MNDINLNISADLSEEWAFAVQSKDFIDGRLNETNDRSTEFDVFTVKFLGSINIDVPNSEEATALAIKSITSIAKCKLLAISCLPNAYRS